MSGTGTRRQAEIRGRRAEKLAAFYLQAKGFRVLAHRYKTPVGEVDLVARRGRILTFVEVKWRGTTNAGLASVTHQAQVRIARAASQWLAHHPTFSTLDQRFDVIALAPWRWPVHLKQAFDAPELF